MSSSKVCPSASRTPAIYEPHKYPKLLLLKLADSINQIAQSIFQFIKEIFLHIFTTTGIILLKDKKIIPTKTQNEQKGEKVSTNPPPPKKKDPQLYESPKISLAKRAQSMFPLTNDKEPKNAPKLLQWCKEGNLNKVREILNTEKDFEVKTAQEQDTPLHIACKNGHQEIVKLLVEKAEINSKNKWGETPLHVAILEKHFDIAELLIEKNAPLEEKDNDGNTPLHIACRFDNPDLIHKLLEKKGKIIDAKNLKGNTPLHLAIYSNNLEVAKELRKKRASVNLPNNNGDTAFHFACVFGRTPFVELLINKANIEKKTLAGQSPLALACIGGSKEIVKLLMDKEADTESISLKEKTPLIYAVEKGHHEIAMYLLSIGAKIDAVDSEKHTPLFFASASGNFEMVKLLIENHADIDKNWIAFEAALEKNHSEIFDYLFQKALEKHSNGNIPLQKACEEGHLNLVKYLLNYGSDIETKNEVGYTPLHSACFCGNLEIVRLLTEKGANLIAECSPGGATPIRVAKAVQNGEWKAVVAYLNEEIQKRNSE